MSRKLTAVTAYSIPIILMIGLIPVVRNEYALTLIYAACIVALLNIRPERNDWLALIFGLLGITTAEWLFVSTGVETFTQHTLFGSMPLWLPFLWAYAFITIKRCLRILDR